jgi:hypothetical protein
MWGLAAALTKLDRGAETIPLIDKCVAQAAGQAVAPHMIPTVMCRSIRYFQKVNAPAGCRATSAMWKNLNRPDAARRTTPLPAGLTRSLSSSKCGRQRRASGLRTTVERANRERNCCGKFMSTLLH